MLIFLLILLFIMFYKVKVCPIGFNDEYMSKDYTESAKGIFAVIIMFSHIRSYISLDSGLWLDSSYNSTFLFIGQAMVSLFFFYSGYGIIKSLEKKKNYLDGFITQRIYKFWAHFALVLPIY